MLAHAPVVSKYVDTAGLNRLHPALIDARRWVVWMHGKSKPTGKFDKIPLSVRTGKPANANDPANWSSFPDAIAAVEEGRCDGIGFVLCDQPIEVDGEPRFVVAIDLDNIGTDFTYAKALRLALGRTYAEISPSGNGVRMLAFSRVQIRSGNAGEGREMYGSGRFMTVTGWRAKGAMVDATEALQSLSGEWFPAMARKQQNRPPLTQALAYQPTPKTPEAVARVNAQLACVSADTTYEKWRDVVWAVMSTGWGDAEDIAREWSMTTPQRFEEHAFSNLVRDFRQDRGITLGTLHHLARQAGWKPDGTVILALDRVDVAPAACDATASRFRLHTMEDLRSMPAMKWLVRGVLPDSGLASIYGPSGSGKSFLAIELGCAIASSRPDWFGYGLTHRPVVYVALEGQAGIRQRLQAWEAANGMQVPDRFRVLCGGAFTLIDQTDARELGRVIRSTLGAGAAVIVDTLNQSAPGADENSSKDMGQVVTNAKALASDIGGLVVLIHHAGKDASRGMRGHSSLNAAMDAVIEVAPGTIKTWQVTKSKDGETGARHCFELVRYTVGTDSDGEDVISCAVSRALPVPTPERRPPTGKNQVVALDALRKYAAQKPGALSMDDALKMVGMALTSDPKHRRSKAKEAIRGLVGAGHLRETEGGISLP